MRKRELSIWGVGPSIVTAGAGYGAIAGIATWMWPQVFLIASIPYPVFLVVGLLLVVGGIVMLKSAGQAIAGAYGKDELATAGVFGLVRHPIYSAWIVFLIPGLVLFSRSWLVFFTPLVAYLVFKSRIGKEDKYLQERFGQAYLDYRQQVNELVPWPKSKHYRA